MSIDLEKIKNNKSIEELGNYGIINIDKPSGPTSHWVDVKVKEALNSVGIKISKTSHFGTLDPKVTGVLPIALGRACRLLGWFMNKNKTYVGVMKMHEPINEELLRETTRKFVGVIEQLPPMRSNVKRQVRKREIYSLEILEINHEKKEVLFLTEVEAGTYIRKLIHDIGLSKGIGGAHMTELRRIKAGTFNEETTITMYQFNEAIKALKEGDEKPLRKIIVPAEVITEILPTVELKDDNKTMKHLLTGKKLTSDMIKEKKLPKNKEFVAFNNDKMIGVYEKINEKEANAKFVNN